MTKGFSFSMVGRDEWLTIRWGGYDYDILMDRIPTPIALLQWLVQVGEKSWREMTPNEIAALIVAVCDRKKFGLYDRHY